MIAKVRIASLEHWCKTFIGRHEFMVGTELEILTHAMRVDARPHNPAVPTRWWPVTEECAKSVHEKIGIPHSSADIWVCEHLLEMD